MQIKVATGLIGARSRLLHTSELNGGIFLTNICNMYCTYVHCTRTHAMYGQYARDLTNMGTRHLVVFFIALCLELFCYL